MDAAIARRIAQALAHRVGIPADPAQIVAGVCVAMWQEVNCNLSTVLGDRGATVLYRRCLHLSRIDFPWLAGPDLNSLRNCLATRSAAEASNASNILIGNLYEVLWSLIGPVLSENLLRSLWAEPLHSK